MNSAIKVVVALLVVALIAVIGMIMMTNQDAGEPKAEAATTSAPTSAPTVTAEETAQPEELNEPQETAETSETSVSEEAQEEAQGNMYEGALAGLTEEEIAKMALAEEQHHGEGETEETQTDAGEEDVGD